MSTRVVHYCNQLGLGGTEGTLDLMCRNLDSSRFEPWVVTRALPSLRSPLRTQVMSGLSHARRQAWRAKLEGLEQFHARKPALEAALGPGRVVLAKDDAELREIILDLDPTILHVHYSGYPEPPTCDPELMRRIPVVVTTNQFELENTAPSHQFVKRIFFVSRWLLENKARWALNDSRATVMYNPVQAPLSQANLRGDLGIPEDAFVIGRVGRSDPHIFDPISLEAYHRVREAHWYFVALAPSASMVRRAKDLGVQNFLALPPTRNEHYLSMLYNTMDVFAHARRDGETFGCAIAEAMIHGLPVVSHRSPWMNAQEEIIGDAGFICEYDPDHYGLRLRQLALDAELRFALGRRAHERAVAEFEVHQIGKRLESEYEFLIERA